MKHEYRLIIIALGIGLGGAASGYALGGYATGGGGDSTASSGSWWSSEASADDRTVDSAETVPIKVEGPENYVCKGCGPTLAERQSAAEMRGYPLPETDFGGGAPAPISVAQESERGFELPDLDGQAVH